MPITIELYKITEEKGNKKCSNTCNKKPLVGLFYFDSDSNVVREADNYDLLFIASSADCFPCSFAASW